MKENEEKRMTREEATTRLQQALTQLAQYSVTNKRLIDYIDYLEAYIAELPEDEDVTKAR